MKKLFFIVIIFISSFVYSQNDNEYSLEKDGKRYPKIVRNIMLLNEGDKIFHDSNTIFFNIDNQRFKHVISKHERIKVCSLKNIKIITVNQLIKDEYIEHNDKTEKEGIIMPPPLNHYNSRVFIIESIDEKINKYEVSWLYSIW